MRLSTRIVRNLAFVVMLASLPLAQANVLAETCGPDWCDSACASRGGYMSYQGCSSCDGGGCLASQGCTQVCEYCDSQWYCNPY
jgi:hypothetical protein